jgi:hypothetical protein
MTITKSEKDLVWQILFAVRNCFNTDGTLARDYYDKVVFLDLTREQRTTLDDLINHKLLR